MMAPVMTSRSASTPFIPSVAAKIATCSATASFFSERHAGVEAHKVASILSMLKKPVGVRISFSPLFTNSLNWSSKHKVYTSKASAMAVDGSAQNAVRANALNLIIFFSHCLNQLGGKLFHLAKPWDDSTKLSICYSASRRLTMGVGSDLGASKGTGGGRSAQDSTKISFSTGKVS